MRKNINARLTISALLLVALAGCALPQTQVPYEVRVPVIEVLKEDSAARVLVAFSERLVLMSSSERLAEKERLQGALLGTAEKIQLALLLSGEQDKAEGERAKLILREIQASIDPEEAHWRPLATLLLQAISARDPDVARLEERLEKQTQLAREQQKKYEQLNERVEQLNKKLETLKAIELSLPARATDAVNK